MSGPNDEGVADPPDPAMPAIPAIPANAAPLAAPAATTPSFFDRCRISLIVGLLILGAIAVGFGLGRIGKNSDNPQNRLTLYGNVDLRQINLSFNDSERIQEVLVQDGPKSHADRFWPGWIPVDSARKRRALKQRCRSTPRSNGRG